MRKKNVTTVLMLLASVYGCDKPTTRTYTYADSVHIQPCWFDTSGITLDLICATLTVPENYDKPAGRQVELPFIMAKAETPNPKTVPLVVAGGGGPGGPLGIGRNERYPITDNHFTNWYTSAYYEGRDIILMDNRGVGSSQPRLNCPEVEQASMEVFDRALSTDELKKFIRTSYGACRQRLVAEGIDISQYHVVNAARDLEQLRLALGVDTLNVYGASYGSTVTLVFERLFPDSARALILDGVSPPSYPSIENLSRQSSQAIYNMIHACRQDDKCLDTFGPDIDKRLTDFLDKLEKNPVLVRVTSPVNYEPVEVLVTPIVMFDALFSALYTRINIEFMPKYLHASMKGNTDYLADLIRDDYVALLTVDSMDEGAAASYGCHDEYQTTDYAIAHAELDKYPFQSYSMRELLTILPVICEIWAVPPSEMDFKAPYTIKTPVLIFSGELDPVTPHEMAARVIDNSRISWSKIWANETHVVIGTSDCPGWTAGEFLENPEANPFVYECDEDENPLDFIVN